jgi:hypothetical protein
MDSFDDIKSLMVVFEEVKESLNQKIQEAEKTARSFDENDQASSLLVSMVPDLKFSLKYTQEAWKGGQSIQTGLQISRQTVDSRSNQMHPNVSHPILMWSCYCH